MVCLSQELQDAYKAIEEKVQLILEEREQKEGIRTLQGRMLLEESSELMEDIKASIKGRRKLTASDWQKIYDVVDKQRPDYYHQIASISKRVSEQKKQFYYLVALGSSDVEIMSLTGLSRSTLWRWNKLFDNKDV